MGAVPLMSEAYKIGPMTIDQQEKKPTPEQRKEQLKALGVPSRIEHLDVGDYQWVATNTNGWTVWTCERKSVKDFIASAEDGRLQRLMDYKTQQGVRVLLLEGDQFQFYQGATEWGPHKIDGMLLSLELEGIVVVRSRAEADTSDRLAALWRYSGRDHPTLHKPYKPVPSASYLLPEERDMVRTLMCLPGWGEVKARRALEEFGSVEMVLAKLLVGVPKDFKDVKGVGKILHERGKELLKRPWTPTSAT